MGFEASKAKQLGRAVEQLKWLDEARTDFDFGLTIECYQRGTESICNAMELAAKEYLGQKLPEFRASVRAQMVKEIARLKAEAVSEVDGLLDKECPGYWPETRELPDDEMVLLGDIYERADGSRCRVQTTSLQTVGKTKMVSPHIVRVLRPVSPSSDRTVEAMREAVAKAHAIEPKRELAIELGKYYVRRDGAVAGPAEMEYGVWCVGSKRYFANGRYRLDGNECPVDLVSEYAMDPMPDLSVVDAEFEVCQADSSEQPVQHELPDDAFIARGDVLHGDTWISTVGAKNAFLGWRVGMVKNGGLGVIRVTRPDDEVPEPLAPEPVYDVAKASDSKPKPRVGCPDDWVEFFPKLASDIQLCDEFDAGDGNWLDAFSTNWTEGASMKRFRFRRPNYGLNHLPLRRGEEICQGAEYLDPRYGWQKSDRVGDKYEPVARHYPHRRPAGPGPAIDEGPDTAESEVTSKPAQAEPVLEQSCCAECDSRKAQSVEELRALSQNETEPEYRPFAHVSELHAWLKQEVDEDGVRVLVRKTDTYNGVSIGSIESWRNDEGSGCAVRINGQRYDMQQLFDEFLCASTLQPCGVLVTDVEAQPEPSIPPLECRYDGNYCTVYARGDYEAIVYGQGSDWIAQRGDVTNHRDNWRHWYAHREMAEQKAMDLLDELFGIHTEQLESEPDQRPTFVDSAEDTFGNPPMSDELPQPKISIGKNHAGKTLKEVLDSFRVTPEMAAKLTEDHCDLVLPKLPDGMTWQEFAASFSDADMAAVREAIRRESMQETNDRFAEGVLKLCDEWLDELGKISWEAYCKACGMREPRDYSALPIEGKKRERAVCEALWRHFRSVRDEEMAKLTELAERAWGVLASVDFGDWSKQSPIWQEEAEKFRKAFYELIGSKKGSVA